LTTDEHKKVKKMDELGDQVGQLMNQNKLKKMDEFGFRDYYWEK